LIGQLIAILTAVPFIVGYFGWVSRGRICQVPERAPRGVPWRNRDPESDERS